MTLGIASNYTFTVVQCALNQSDLMNVAVRSNGSVDHGGARETFYLAIASTGLLMVTLSTCSSSEQKDDSQTNVAKLSNGSRSVANHAPKSDC